MTYFQSSTKVTDLGDGRFEANLDRGWWVFRGPHGGYLSAIILRAITETVDADDRAVRSFTTIIITVGGREHSFSQGFVRFRSDGSQLEFLRATNNNTWGLGFSEERFQRREVGNVGGAPPYRVRRARCGAGSSRRTRCTTWST